MRSSESLWWELVGRDEELAFVDAAMRAGRAGVVVAGPPGVGKSRLLAEVLARSQQAGRATGFVRATRSAASVPFGAFVRYVPDDGGVATRRIDVMRKVAEAVEASASGRPQVLAVDDAHLLDEASAALLLHLAESRPAFLVTSVRTGERAPDAVVALWKDGLAERVELQPLSSSESIMLVELALGGRIEASTANRLANWSRGNPLYLREVVLAGRQRGALRRDRGVWTWHGPALDVGDERLLVLVRDRLGGLDPDVRSTIDFVAFGEPLELGLLHACVASASVDRAEECGVVVVAEEDARRVVRLAHPLYGESIRTTMPAGRAASVRRRLAEAACAEAGGSRQLTGDVVLRVATWYLLSGDPPANPGLFLAAARRATAMSDHGLAARLAAHARAVGGGDAALLARAEALYWDGRFEETVSAIDEIAGRDPATVTRAAILAVSALFWGLGDPVSAEARLVAARRQVPDGPERNELVAHHASLMLFNGRADEALASALSVLSSPTAGVSARVRALSPAIAAWAVEGRRAAAAGAASLGLPFALERREELPEVAGELALGWCLGLVLAGELDEAEALAVGARDAVLAEGALAFLATWTLVLGRIALTRGRVTPAASLLDEAVTGLRDDDPGGLLAWGLALRAHAATLCGDVPSARGLLAAAAEVRTEAVNVYLSEVCVAEAVTLAAAGERSAARAAARRAIDASSPGGVRVGEAQGWHQLARLGRARDAVEPLDRLARVIEGPLIAAQRAHAIAMSDDDGAALVAVSQQFAAMGMMLVAAEASLAAASSFERSGHRGSRLAALVSAEELAAECPGAALARDLTDARDASLDKLTDREREVVLLVGQGLSNRELADQLFLSVRTVNNHLNHAYAKLGLTSRDDLVRVARRRSSTPTG